MRLFQQLIGAIGIILKNNTLKIYSVSVVRQRKNIKIKGQWSLQTRRACWALKRGIKARHQSFLCMWQNVVKLVNG